MATEMLQVPISKEQVVCCMMESAYTVGSSFSAGSRLGLYLSLLERVYKNR